MKYLLIIAVLVVAYLLWRAPRARAAREDAAKPAPPALAQDMVRCPVCSLHLPRPEAVPGTSGRLYCSADHRRSGGD